MPWLRMHTDLLVLLVMLLVAGGVLAFVSIADEVVEGDTQHFDERILKALRRTDDLATPIGPRWLEQVGLDITALGGVAVLSIVTLSVAGYLLMVRKYHAMWLVIAATLGGLIISTILKGAFDRPRPRIVPHLTDIYTSSFPSGHSMMSASVYLTLGSLLTRLVPNRGTKLYFLVLALCLTILVGCSRVYAGVHYPTDVLAGWTAGLVWASLCWLVARRLQMRGSVEKDTEMPPA